MSTAAIGDITVAYDDEGSGEPLLLVHGHPFDRTMWRPQVARFSQLGYRVIAPDLRGYGHTTVVPGVTPLATFARDLAGLLDHLGVPGAVIAGLSLGGQIAMEFHRLYPHRVRGLVLADTAAQAETVEGKQARYALADRLLSEGMGPYAASTLPMMVAPANIATQPAVAAHVLTMMRGAHPAGAAAALRGRAERPDYAEMLATVPVPALVVVGSEDQFTPVSDAQLMHERLPDSTLVVVDGAGHMPNLERPAVFDAALEQLLQRTCRKPTATFGTL